MARCHAELYKPGKGPMESRLLLAVPDTPSARKRLQRAGCRRRGCFIMTHCPGVDEKTILRHDGRGWREVR